MTINRLPPLPERGVARLGVCSQGPTHTPVRALRLPKSRRVWASSSVAVVRRPRPVRGVPRPPDRPPLPSGPFLVFPPWSSAPAREPPSSALPPPPAAPPPVPLAVARWGTLGEGRASSRGEGRVRPGGVPPRVGRLGSTWGREESSRERLWGRVTEAEGPRAGLRGRRGRRLRRRRRRPVRVEPEREVVRAGVAWRGVRFPSLGF